jgi:hypothetical protein
MEHPALERVLDYYSCNNRYSEYKTCGVNSHYSIKVKETCAIYLIILYTCTYIHGPNVY